MNKLLRRTNKKIEKIFKAKFKPFRNFKLLISNFNSSLIEFISTNSIKITKAKKYLISMNIDKHTWIIFLDIRKCFLSFYWTKAQTRFTVLSKQLENNFLDN